MLDVRTLHRHMGAPEWTAVQWTSAEQILAATETDLADALYGAVIEPVEISEAAPVDRQGQVATSYPVFALVAVDGVLAPEGAPPPGYRLQRHRLSTVGPSTPGSLGPLFGPRSGPEPFYPSEVAVHYLGGWGPEPTLVNAILEKASARMDNRHADTMVITGVTAQPMMKPPSKNWTEEDLAPLGRYRNLGWAHRR